RSLRHSHPLSISFLCPHLFSFFFFFNDPPTTEIYTLSLHDALPIYTGHLVGHLVQLLDREARRLPGRLHDGRELRLFVLRVDRLDRKSTRLNSSHVKISYAVFCLKKKKKTCRPRAAALNGMYKRDVE